MLQILYKNSTLFGFTLISMFFFEYLGFPTFYTNLIFYIAISSLFLYVIKTFLLQTNNIYYKLMRGIVLLTAFSMVMALLFWDQSIIRSLKVTLIYLIPIFYFYLYKTRPKLQTIEYFIYFFAFTYIILWVYALLMFPTRIFGYHDANGLSESGELITRGIFRFNFVGRGFLVIAFFLSLNKYILLKRKKFLYLSLLFFLMIILQVTRQLLLFSFIVGFYYVLRNNRYVWLYISLILFLLFVTPNLVNLEKIPIIRELTVETSDQIMDQKQGEENVRIQAYKYFFSNNWSKNILTDIFGNGIPDSQSEYFNVFGKAASMGYGTTDAGYAGMYIYTGYLGLFLYISLFLISAFSKVPPEYMFAKLYMIFMIPMNFGADWYSKVDFCIIMCICVYLIGQYNINNNQRRYSKNIDNYAKTNT